MVHGYGGDFAISQLALSVGSDILSPLICKNGLFFFMGQMAAGKLVFAKLWNTHS